MLLKATIPGLNEERQQTVGIRRESKSMVQSAFHSLRTGQAAINAQLARFIVSGILVTALGVAVYGLFALALRWHPQLGNFLAYIIAMGTGYAMHSCWSFRNHGSRTYATKVRFVMASLAGLVLNSFWVWLFTVVFRFSPVWPIAPMLFVTPAVTFFVNRHWVFR